ncbi:MAG: DUF885 domain-containing protein [Cyanobacteria bacterium SZAS TMP-1]|nr:DUF885 domain-containing protein [Cyanobacteria bacterium SZAS TMP-1]
MKSHNNSSFAVASFLALCTIAGGVFLTNDAAIGRAASVGIHSSKFGTLSDAFVKEALVLNPSSASQAGYHSYKDAHGKTIFLDAVLDDLSEAAMKKQRDFYAAWQKRFEKETPVASLNDEDRADYQLIEDQINQQLLEFDEIQNYRHNPTVVVELIGTALFQPLTENYAAKDVRLGHVIERIKQIPRLINSVKEYQNNADPIFIKTAIEENAGNVDLIKSTVAKEIPDGSPLKKEFDAASAPAIKALEDYSKWLADDLGKRPCNRGWRLGKDLYDRKFKLVMEADITPAALLADAESSLQSVRAEMLELCLPLHKKWYPDHEDHSNLKGAARENLVISEVLSKISDNHPKRDQLQQAVEADLESIKKFIRDKKIVSLAQRENLKVIPTPLFQRGIYSVAGFHSAPPLNPKAEAEYWVTPIDASVSEAKAESKLREYNNYTLKWLTIHEALPGHYVQFEHLNNVQPERRRLLRSMYANGPYVEGWAEYIAQVMMDEGYMKDDPSFRIIMRKIRLRLLANTILDIKMQSQDMTDAQAMELMTKETFQTEAEAEGKLRRAKLSSAQLATYYTGLREWQSFRKKYQEKLGKNFNLLKFHDLVLDEGSLPVPIVEKLVMERLAPSGGKP